MTNPLTLWSQWMNAGNMAGETIAAASQVVARRSQTIAAAASDPLRADHSELALMVSEKGAAFSRSGTSLAIDAIALQGELMAQAQAVGAMMLSGRTPTLAAAGAIMDRGARINQKMLTAGVRALRPLHTAATANQRRLAKKA